MLNFKSFLKEHTVYTQQYLLENDLLEEQWDMLNEESKVKKVEADDKGKLYELLTSGYLHPKSGDGFHSKTTDGGMQLPSHHRAFADNPDHAGTPEQVHDKLRKKVGEEAYQEINRHSHQMAQKVKAHLKKHGHIGTDGLEIGDSFWTSNPDKVDRNGRPIAGDHQATTGIHDPNAKGDMMVRFHKRDSSGKLITDESGNPKPFGHHAFSAKYGYSKEANLANMGLDTIEKYANLPSGTFEEHQKVHRKAMDELGHHGSADQRNIQSKIDAMDLEDSKDKKGETVPGIYSEHARLEAKDKVKPLVGKEKIMHEHLGKFIEAGKTHPGGIKALKTYAFGRHTLAKKSADDATKKVAADAAIGLHGSEPNTPEGNAARTDRLKGILHKIVSPPTKVEHTIIHSHVGAKGEAEHHVMPMAGMGERHTSQFSEMRVRHNGGNSFVFEGKLNKPGHPKHGQFINAATITTKTGSGIHKGRVFTAKLNNQDKS